MGNITAAHCFYLSKKCKAKPPVGSSTYMVIMAAAAVPGKQLPIAIRGVFLPKGIIGCSIKLSYRMLSGNRTPPIFCLAVSSITYGFRGH